MSVLMNEQMYSYTIKASYFDTTIQGSAVISLIPGKARSDGLFTCVYHMSCKLCTCITGNDFTGLVCLPVLITPILPRLWET